MDLLKECILLKIDDILPFFPDFVTIDHFKVSYHMWRRHNKWCHNLNSLLLLQYSVGNLGSTNHKYVVVVLQITNSFTSKTAVKSGQSVDHYCSYDCD